MLTQEENDERARIRSAEVEDWGRCDRLELPLTQPCPQCGAEMEPSKAVRRGRVIYECPECGYQMEISETPRVQSLDEALNGDVEDDEEDTDDENNEDETEDGDDEEPR